MRRRPPLSGRLGREDPLHGRGNRGSQKGSITRQEVDARSESRSKGLSRRCGLGYGNQRWRIPRVTRTGKSLPPSDPLGQATYRCPHCLEEAATYGGGMQPLPNPRRAGTERAGGINPPFSLLPPSPIGLPSAKSNRKPEARGAWVWGTASESTGSKER